jgi:D-alanine-D-alanine ligase
MSPATTLQVESDWWKDIFDDFYLQTDARSVCDNRLTRREVDFIEEALSCDKSSAVLDFCGGQGRHALELARRGFTRVTLLDYSDCLTRLGRKEASREALATNFIRGDARYSGLRSRSFSAVIIMGSSFGYFVDDRENRKMLQEAYRLLLPGGELLLDLPDRAFVLSRFKPVASHRINDDLEVIRTREHDQSVVYCRETVVSRTKGCLRDLSYCTRLYSPEQITKLLMTEGFSRIAFQKDFLRRDREGDFGTMTNRMMVRAEKRPYSHSEKT